jgi:Trk K+ transport system NAD-binding subunit
MKLRPKLPASGESSDDVAKTEYCVFGGEVGAQVARRLRADGYAVSRVGERSGALADVRTLKDAEVFDGSTVIVATRRDSRNLLVAQLVRTHFDVSEIVVLANARDRLDAFTEAGHEPICATTALSDALIEEI